jgi:hypothetical protein
MLPLPPPRQAAAAGFHKTATPPSPSCVSRSRFVFFATPPSPIRSLC